MTDLHATPEKKRILIVEDDALIAMLLEDVVDLLGFTLAGSAATVPAALALLAEGVAVDAALLDINLAGQRVFPVADELVRRGIPFAFCSGYGEAGVDTAAYAGAPTISKPFDIDGLGNLLRRL
ncbi:response regulator [Robbsia sp. Bb-Pol-6]|uniref:Response regulator n=1 Tax=Robbsia betulipollinis TaxID=2981849 RepID=A0ABT3ZS65_9BURK|nr:response regulator [Robbsia betulipollinis]MCY0389395.1 response regulator [Robbsia betulipollinis]